MPDSNRLFSRGRKSTTGERRKQDRSVQTRAKLIAAARQIFVRDGFEKARLEDISAMVGKTRGAFYAHFRDKEDVFFAIFEENVARGKAQLKSELSRSQDEGTRFEALVAHIATVIRDQEQMFLNLEFKLYAIRHKTRHKRLSNLHADICMHGCDGVVTTSFPEFSKDAENVRTRVAKMGALIDGLALNRYFDPVSLNDQSLHEQIRAGLRNILRSEPKTNRSTSE